MSINSNVEIMKTKWETLGIEKEFSKIHHFSSDKFKTKPSGLKGFYNWCQNREIQDENLQTVNRALKTASLVEKGYAIESSITAAWAEFQLVKR